MNVNFYYHAGYGYGKLERTKISFSYILKLPSAAWLAFPGLAWHLHDQLNQRHSHSHSSNTFWTFPHCMWRDVDDDDTVGEMLWRSAASNAEKGEHISLSLIWVYAALPQSAYNAYMERKMLVERKMHEIKVLHSNFSAIIEFNWKNIYNCFTKTKQDTNSVWSGTGASG